MTRAYDRGKIMTAEMLEEGRDFGRYLDVDGDGIPYAPIPARIRPRAPSSPRGTSRDRYARYSRKVVYADNMQRLVRKFETAQDMVPRPLQANAAKLTKYGVIYFGSTRPRWTRRSGCWRRAASSRSPAHPRLPVPLQRGELHRDHDFIYVIEQNREASFDR